MLSTLNEQVETLEPAPASVPAISLLTNVPESIDDPIDVWLARVQRPGDLATAVGLRQWPFDVARTIVVDARAVRLDEADIAALSRLAGRGIRVVIAGASLAMGFPPMLVLRDPEFRRSAVAAIYGLDPGQTAVLVSPEPADGKTLRGLVRHAMRWRASWREPEEGDLSARPA